MNYSPELGGIIYQVASMARREGGISFAGGYPAPELFDTEGLGAAFAELFADDDARAALQYGEREGYPALRARLAAFSAGPATGSSVEVGVEDVIVANGGQQGIATTVQVLARPGDTVFMERPTFPTALQAFHLARVEGVGIECDDQGMIPDALEQALRRQRPKFLYTVPTFSNPAGSVLALERRLRVLELAVEHEFYVLEDDPYSHLWFDVPPPPSLLALSARVPGARERVIHVSSLSKLVSPGLRLGWMIPPRALRQEMVWHKLATDIHSALPTQYALERYWAAGRFDAHVPKIRATYRERSLAMHAALERHCADHLQFTRPAGGMFMWCRVRKGTDARELLEAARRAGVFFVPGIAFYPDRPELATFRLSFATMSPARIVEGIQRLAGVLAAA